MINFYLPNFYERTYRDLNMYFIYNIKNHPEKFYEDINIGALFGVFPGTIWNGGRISLGEVSSKEIKRTIEYYDRLNIPIRFTYTNSLITPEHLNDSQANYITELAHTGKNEILVNSPILEEYLRATYPNYKYLSSTTKCLVNNKDILQESKNYYLTVLDFRKNIDFNFLKSLKNPEQYELLINAYCDPRCKQRQYHYDVLSRGQLENRKLDIPCEFKKSNFLDAVNSLPTVIKVEDLYSTYANMGFKHFKIEGRTDHIINVVESYIYYMVKPEYKDQIRHEVLMKIITKWN